MTHTAPRSCKLTLMALVTVACIGTSPAHALGWLCGQTATGGTVMAEYGQNSSTSTYLGDGVTATGSVMGPDADSAWQQCKNLNAALPAATVNSVGSANNNTNKPKLVILSTITR
jgi:hypothetical protein